MSSADVVARVNGTITKVLFEDGQYVTAGQPLYIIESSTYLDDVNSAQGALETATAEHDFAVRNTLQTGNHVESRRLAASARAKKSRQLPVLEYNIDVVDCGGLAKLFCQIFYSNFHLCTPPQ